MTEDRRTTDPDEIGESVPIDPEIAPEPIDTPEDEQEAGAEPELRAEREPETQGATILEAALGEQGEGDLAPEDR